MIKIDLHTHSIGSPDGGIKPEEYAALLENDVLDYIAVTDHNTIHVAQMLHKSLGDRIIVGEEVMTRSGELDGLYLTAPIAPGMSALDAAKAIKAQGGLVYVPHPLEKVRKGLTAEALETIANYIDIVEVHNGRAVLQNEGPRAHTWARLNNKAIAASSDAHGQRGLGHTFSVVSKQPNAKNLTELLSRPHIVVNRPPLRSLLYPKYHRLKKKIGRNS